MRRAEREGRIRPPENFRELVAALPFSPEEIDDAFDLLVTPEGPTVGGTVALADADEYRGAALAASGLVEVRPDEGWCWTEKGSVMIGYSTSTHPDASGAVCSSDRQGVVGVTRPSNVAYAANSDQRVFVSARLRIDPGWIAWGWAHRSRTPLVLADGKLLEIGPPIARWGIANPLLSKTKEDDATHTD